jgi:poly(A) polymerase
MARPERPSMPLREAARGVAAELLSAGFESYFAGGCVRDRLLGGEPEDYDIATAATPEEVKRIFPRAQGVGESFGVMLVRHGGHLFEVATFRTDGAYSDGRRPDAVRFSSAAEDAARRDFSINGLFEEPLTGAIRDFVGGEADLRAGVIRAIGDPRQRFSEDHLRLLRGVRFAARFGFAIEDRTAQAMREHAPKLALIARERIGGELAAMLEPPTRVEAAAMLEAFGLDAAVLREAGRPPLVGVAPQPLAHLGALPRMGRVPFAVALAAWGLDRTGGAVGREFGAAAGLASRWREALLLSNRDEEGMLGLLGSMIAAAEWEAFGVAQRKRWAGAAWALWAESLLTVADPAAAESIGRWRAGVAPESIAPPPLLSGNHLIQAGYAPGPAFKAMLDAAYDAQLEGHVQTADEALEMLRRSFS